MSEGKSDIGIIGVGSIAAAIVKGIMRTGKGASVVLSPRGAQTSAALSGQFPNAIVASSNQEVIDRSQLVLICIRPQDADAVLSALRFRREQTVISAMAGVRVSALRRLTSPATVCRSIPLPALAQVRRPTPVHPPVPAATALFDPLGGVVEIDDEAVFDAFSAVTGTISATMVYLSTISAWLAEHGVGQADADRYVASIFSGLDLSPTAVKPLNELARHHVTPGGINEAFVTDLSSVDFTGAIRRGLDRIQARLLSRS